MKERAPELTREGERYPSRDAGPRLPARRSAGARAGTAHRRRPVVAAHAAADGAQPHQSLAARGRRLVHRRRYRAGGGGMPRRVGVARAGAARAPSAERVFVTHDHPDHMGLASWIAERHGAAVWMSQWAHESSSTFLRMEPAEVDLRLRAVPARPRSSIPGRERAATRPPHLVRRDPAAHACARRRRDLHVAVACRGR